ncbi:MAG: DUF924 domain-containing protein [Coxiellaceae bacterium]|nr:DUF924 domain-containing protein [Coxiellaceae bacterium]
MQHNEKIEDILSFWFGHVEETIVPSENRARIWFGESVEIDAEIKSRFSEVYDAALMGECDSWMETGRGQLALIILLDQFSRHIFRNTPKAYEQDERALAICVDGIKRELDHDLSLIERVFFYFPFLHSEKLEYQEQSIHAYQTLSELAFAETRVIYDSFLKFANHHYTLVQRFGRFPQRNKVLGRMSTPEESAYLKEIDEEQSQT